MSVRVPVKPELISWALDQAQTTPAQLREGTQVEGWLAGVQQPTLKQLQDFAAHLHIPFGYLMLSEPPVAQLPIPDFRRRSFGSGRHSQELTESIYSQQRKQAWFRDYAVDRGLDVVGWVKSAGLGDSPAEVAQRLRLEWGFATALRPQDYAESRREVFTLLEAQGVLVSVAGFFGSTRRPFSVEEFSGFSLSDEYTPVIFVNGKEAYSAQIFTMLHEVGHLVLGESAVSDDAAESRGAHRSERWCDEFAAAFLMPADEVGRLAPGSLSEDAVLRVAKRFRVSALGLLNRLRDLGIISYVEWADVYPEFEQRAFAVLESKLSEKSSGGDFYRAHTYTVGRRFARAVYRDALSWRTSYPEAYRLLGLPKVSTFNKFAQEIGV